MNFKKPALFVVLCLMGAAPAAAAGRAGPQTLSPQFSWLGGGATPWVGEAERWVGSGKFTGLPGAWCADAVNYWLRATGKPPLPGRMASSALAYGHADWQPQRGDVAVMRSHVGLVEGVEPNGSIDLVSGNWGHRVAHAVLPRRVFVAFRTP